MILPQQRLPVNETCFANRKSFEFVTGRHSTLSIKLREQVETKKAQHEAAPVDG
jgi:hypothetical protein